MADSETSRTLPIETCANLPKVVSEFLAVSLGGLGWTTNSPTKKNDPSEINEMWERWRAARTTQLEFGRQQQNLETKLLATTGGFPHVALTVPGASITTLVQTASDIDRVLAGIDLVEDRSQAKVALASARAIWDKADTEIGYSVACAAEHKAYERVQRLAEEIFRKQASSVDEAIAKLHCLIEMEEPGPDFKETPWPQLRGILRDLLALR